ncbi:hypothetical protein DCS_02464 [Drechmeria coniospora]|uniref:Killer toxin Kp4 domain-containing protein n=1 Tax=Drechmeria coniospora TaxID=98403 RepID=A0A151GWB6_DRECN|nr:hypothetical protein DCS_02464 [Drechmeria coniospora]KYK61322.1 hypothetical protein DCS_02464 [Drechmeria coniospora]ODA81086.1 hypothetical protein RJ55_04049 [Drechmeria coniospora]
MMLLSIAFVAVAALVASASAHAVSCRGEVACPLNDGQLIDLLVQFQKLQKQGKGSRYYKPGVQIACADGPGASMCAFYQRGAGGNVNTAAKLVQSLLDRKCSRCGSFHPARRDVSKGELVINLVTRACCEGNCICPR